MSGWKVSFQLTGNVAVGSVAAKLVGVPGPIGAFQGMVFTVLNDIVAPPLIECAEKILGRRESRDPDSSWWSMLQIARLTGSLVLASLATMRWGYLFMGGVGRVLPGFVGRVLSPGPAAPYLFVDALRLNLAFVGISSGLGVAAAALLLYLYRAQSQRVREGLVEL